MNSAASTEIYSLPLPDPLPISVSVPERTHHRRHARTVHQPVVRALLERDPSPRERLDQRLGLGVGAVQDGEIGEREDRKSTRLNSSHANISYAAFCLAKTDILG